MVPSAAVVSGKKTNQKPPSEEVVMIQAWNLEYLMSVSLEN